MKYKADISLLFVAFVWGATFVVVQNAIAFLPPLLFNGVRFAIASILLWIWVFIFERKPLDKQLIRAGFILGIWLCLGYAFQTIGLLYTTSSKAGFITGLNVVLVPFLSFMILKQKTFAECCRWKCVSYVWAIFFDYKWRYVNEQR